MPYITASIIFQLLTVIYEPLAKLPKEGEMGRRKITQWTRYVTVMLGVVQSIAIALTLTNTQTGQSMVTIGKWSFIPLCVLTLTAGHGVHHVAGGADYRARDWERHEPPDLHGYCGGSAEGD